MRLIAILILGLAALAAGVTASRAEDGCGRGWYWNGYRCAPFRHAREPERHHDDWRYRHHRHHDWDDHDRDGGPRYFGGAPRYYGGGARYHPPSPKWHTSNGCPPHYTVQDGLCKPYRGY